MPTVTVRPVGALGVTFGVTVTEPDAAEVPDMLVPPALVAVTLKV